MGFIANLTLFILMLIHQVFFRLPLLWWRQFRGRVRRKH